MQESSDSEDVIVVSDDEDPGRAEGGMVSNSSEWRTSKPISSNSSSSEATTIEEMIHLEDGVQNVPPRLKSASFTRTTFSNLREGGNSVPHATATTNAYGNFEGRFTTESQSHQQERNIPISSGEIPITENRPQIRAVQLPQLVPIRRTNEMGLGDNGVTTEHSNPQAAQPFSGYSNVMSNNQQRQGFSVVTSNLPSPLQPSPNMAIPQHFPGGYTRDSSTQTQNMNTNYRQGEVPIPAQQNFPNAFPNNVQRPVSNPMAPNLPSHLPPLRRIFSTDFSFIPPMPYVVQNNPAHDVRAGTPANVMPNNPPRQPGYIAEITSNVSLRMPMTNRPGNLSSTTRRYVSVDNRQGDTYQNNANVMPNNARRPDTPRAAPTNPPMGQQQMFLLNYPTRSVENSNAQRQAPQQVMENRQAEGLRSRNFAHVVMDNSAVSRPASRYPGMENLVYPERPETPRPMECYQRGQAGNGIFRGAGEELSARVTRRNMNPHELPPQQQNPQGQVYRWIPTETNPGPNTVGPNLQPSPGQGNVVDVPRGSSDDLSQGTNNFVVQQVVDQVIQSGNISQRSQIVIDRRFSRETVNMNAGEIGPQRAGSSRFTPRYSNVEHPYRLTIQRIPQNNANQALNNRDGAAGAAGGPLGGFYMAEFNPVDLTVRMPNGLVMPLQLWIQMGMPMF